MSREKKPQVDDLTKLRRILDNPSDPALESLLIKDERTLESVRRRLRRDFSTNKRQSSGFFPSFTSMEPRVFVHEKTPFIPCSTTTTPTSKITAPLPKFELASPATPGQPLPSQELILPSEELFEVEKVDQLIPEFVEVSPPEPSSSQIEKKPNQYDDVSNGTSNLPEWQPIEEENETSVLESHKLPSPENIPEFERVSSPPTPDNIQKQVEKESIETPVDFLLVEQLKPSFIKISKKREREAKRAKRAKERETKRLQKIELKRIKKEKEQDKEKTIKDEPLFPPSEESQPSSESVTPVETPSITGDMAAFKGINSIDEKTAELLYTHGYFSIENIRDATLNDLVQIRGIRRKLAKQIKKEIEQTTSLIDDTEFVPVKKKTIKKTQKNKLHDAAEWESHPPLETPKSTFPPVCVYEGYTLFKRETTTRDRRKTTIHFFSKEKPKKGQPTSLPDGYQIAINKKTEVPYLKRK